MVARSARRRVIAETAKGLFVTFPPVAMGCRCGGGAEHEHAVDPEAASAKSLHSFVDFAQSSVLNAQSSGGGLGEVLRAKYSGGGGQCLESDADQQLLLKIQ